MSNFLYLIERGIKRLASNTKLLFLTAVLFIFPLLFILVLESFYNISESMVQRAERQGVNAMHDTVQVVLQESERTVSDVLLKLQRNNEDVTQFNILQSTDSSEVMVIASSNLAEIGATTSMNTTLRLGSVTPGVTFEIDTVINDVPTVQAIRYLKASEGDLYIFSEHSRDTTYEILEQRKQNAYLLLTLLFLFMIGLAYWINKQTNWQNKFETLESSLKERDLFINMIAHEFRTPLTAIKGYASFLTESEAVSKEDSRFASIINDSAQRLVLLVNDFLEVARIQSGKMDLDLKVIDVRDVLQEVVNSLQGKAGEKNLELVYTRALKPQYLKMDRNRLIQILTNIASNAIKYTDEGVVEITCDFDRSGATIRIKDTGMGISIEDQAKLFRPFSRVGGVEETTTTGTGLGMWITKHLVEMLQGTIAVESIQGIGTHIVIKFKRTN